MLATGIRVGSDVALDVDDAELDAGVLHLRTAKGDRPDDVYVGREVAEHLREFIGDRASGPLFLGRTGRRLPTRHVHRRLAHWTREAGIERAVSPHSLRHSFASALYKRSQDVFLVQQALCYRSIGSTLVYAHCDEERLRRAVGA